jgi:hypothetical protein
MPVAPSNNTVVLITKPDRLDNPSEFVADDFQDEDIQAAVDELTPMRMEPKRSVAGSYTALMGGCVLPSSDCSAARRWFEAAQG